MFILWLIARIAWLVDWLIIWLIDWLTDGLTDWLIDLCGLRGGGGGGGGGVTRLMHGKSNRLNTCSMGWLTARIEHFFYVSMELRQTPVGPGGCFTNVSRAPHNNLAKIYKARNYIHGENFKLKRCTCAQSMDLGTRTKFQLEILIRSTISAIHKFRENILESSRNVGEHPGL